MAEFGEMGFGGEPEVDGDAPVFEEFGGGTMGDEGFGDDDGHDFTPDQDAGFEPPADAFARTDTPPATAATPAVEEDVFAAAGAGADESKTDDDNKLAAFNARFREEGRTKDNAEEAAKRERAEAAKAALAEHFGIKGAQLDKKKQSNREAERANEEEMEAALHGESWERVASLIDVTTDAPESEVSRMKQVLIQLKSSPLPPVGGPM